ncbi:MAG: divergent polysaccharide deacetylase family protein [Geminicoccaceae bacterium]|nr:divergent polysaccharide deacetylase family protein [Geminicoccaceae bacterium]
MDLKSSRLPFFGMVALLLGIGLGAATMWLFDIRGDVSLEGTQGEVVMPLPATLHEEVPAPTEMIYGVDWHSPGPGPLPKEERINTRPPVEIFTKLLENSPYGRIPRRSEDGSTSLRTYAAAEPVAEAKGGSGPAVNAVASGPRIAIMVIDLGLDKQVSSQSVALPPALSFGVSPYVSTTADWQRFMRWNGHETLTMMPVETSNPNEKDEGALALTVDGSDADRIDEAQQVMSRGLGYIGLTGAANSFAVEPEAFAAVAGDLAGRGLGFVEIGGTFLQQIAAEQGLPYTAMTMALDSDLTPALIDRQLRDLERLALASGVGTAYTRPVPVVLDRIWNWSQGLSEKGITLVPVSELMQSPG